jgi:hypothetical protein
MKQLIIIRGLPGTGTYELGEQLQRSLDVVPHWSPEKYFDKPEANEPNPRLYHPLLVPMAERWCFDAVYETLGYGAEGTVIVSDVFLTRDSVEEYRRLGRENGANVVVLQTTDRGINPPADVPKAVMDELRNRWEEL